MPPPEKAEIKKEKAEVAFHERHRAAIIDTAAASVVTESAASLVIVVLWVQQPLQQP